MVELNEPAARKLPRTVFDHEAGLIRLGYETILLTEDEPSLRDKLRGTLESAGDRVLVAHDGQQAFATAMGDRA